MLIINGAVQTTQDIRSIIDAVETAKIKEEGE